ncbi:hypothetical protein C8R46DRAFT_1198216 [Mycena filopes]|nr:hypothetical protein C8R46DRAFT_1198216 [Mycena filopes]
MAPTRTGASYLKEWPTGAGDAPAPSDSGAPSGASAQSREGASSARDVDDVASGGPSAASEHSERGSDARDSASGVFPVQPRSFASVVDDRSDGRAASEADATKASQKAVGFERAGNGFHKPKVSASRSPVRTPSPIESIPRFFPLWFEDNKTGVKDEDDDAMSWYNLPEEGLGDVPAWDNSRSKEIKIETLTPNLTPIDQVMDQVYEQADTPTREALAGRKHFVETHAANGDGPSDSDSDSDSGCSSTTTHKGRKTRGSPKRGRKSSPKRAASAPKSIVSETTTAAMANRIPAYRKGKGIDPTERSGKAPPTPIPSDSEPESDDEQLKADLAIAQRLQEQLDKEANEARTLHDEFLIREAAFIKEREARLLRESELRASVEALRKRAAKKARQREAKSAKRSASPVEIRIRPKKAKRRDRSTSRAERRAKRKASEERKKPQRYRTASAKLPKGSCLRRAMKGNEPDDSDYSSSSDDSGSDSSVDLTWKLPDIPSSSSSEDSGSDFFPEEPDSEHSSDSEPTKSAKRRAKRRYKDAMARMKFQQGFLKADPPFVYDGEAKADIFNKWMREVRNFGKLGLLSPRQLIRMAGKYLRGKAYKWYDREILNAKKKIKWTLSRFFKELFDELFPADFRARQRDAFDACEQGNRKVKDFMQKLQDLANTIGNISDEDLVLAFWRRCESYLRVEFTRLGFEAESISLKQLMKIAEREERVHFLIEEERKKAAKKSGDKEPGKKFQKDKPTGSTKDETKSEKPANDKKSKEQRNKDYRDSKEQKDNKKKEARERKKRLRDEGLCFNCEKSGHLSKDCPDAQKVPAPAARAVRVDFAEIERLKAVKLASKLGLMAMYPVDPYKTAEWSDAYEEVLTAKAMADLHGAVPFLWDNLDDPDPGNTPGDPKRLFIYSTGDDEFTIIDHHQGIDYTVPKSKLAEDDFDLVDWVKWQMAEDFNPKLAGKIRSGNIPTVESGDESDEVPDLESVSFSSDSDGTVGSYDEPDTDFAWSDSSSDSDPDMPPLGAVSESEESGSDNGSDSQDSSNSSFEEISLLNLSESEEDNAPGDLWSDVFDYCVRQANGEDNSPLMDAVAREIGWADYVNAWDAATESDTDEGSEQESSESEEFSHHVQRVWNEIMRQHTGAEGTAMFSPCSGSCGMCENYSQKFLAPKPEVRVSMAKPKKPAQAVPDPVERNASREKKPDRVVPMGLVVIVRLNGEPVRALLDSGLELGASR